MMTTGSMAASMRYVSPGTAAFLEDVAGREIGETTPAAIIFRRGNGADLDDDGR